MGDRPGPFAGVLEFSQRVGQGKLIFQEGSTRDFRRGSGRDIRTPKDMAAMSTARRDFRYFSLGID